MNSVMIIIDKETPMTAHLIACCKSVAEAQSAPLDVGEVAIIHGIPFFLYSDRIPQFTSKFWKEPCGFFGTQLRCSAAYNPRKQGIV